jgi:hypothetical protein
MKTTTQPAPSRSFVRKGLALAGCVPILLLAAAGPGRAGAPALPDAIRLQSGCFEVTYRFAEPGQASEAPTTVKEYIALQAKGDKPDAPVTLTHIGIFGGKPTWHFEDVWSKRPDGAWRLQVMGRNGPRYTCEGKLSADRLHCKAPGAAKPLRDKERTDYDKLDRGISLFVRPQMWAQQEYNDKLKNDGTLVSVEVGLIEYKRLDDKECASAQKNPPSRPAPG